MKQLLNDILLSDRAAKRGYFDMNFLRNIVRDHLTGKADHTYRLWSLLCLELWHLMFIDKVISRSDNLS